MANARQINDTRVEPLRLQSPPSSTKLKKCVLTLIALTAVASFLVGFFTILSTTGVLVSGLNALRLPGGIALLVSSFTLASVGICWALRRTAPPQRETFTQQALHFLQNVNTEFQPNPRALPDYFDQVGSVLRGNALLDDAPEGERTYMMPYLYDRMHIPFQEGTPLALIVLMLENTITYACKGRGDNQWTVSNNSFTAERENALIIRPDQTSTVREVIYRRDNSIYYVRTGSPQRWILDLNSH